MAVKIAIQIDPSDNVVTVVEAASPGDVIEYASPDGPRRITAAESIPACHKIAIREIPPEEPILKYGQPIGTASQAIDLGRHVHVQNVRSAVQGAERED